MENNVVVSNVGKKWSEVEENEFIEELKRQVSLKEIASTHKRTIGGIKARREKLVYDFHLKGVSREEIKQITNLDDVIITYIIENASAQEQLKKSLKDSEKLTETSETFDKAEKTPRTKKTTATEIADLKNQISLLKNEIDNIHAILRNLA